jgi:Secretion system C-terminal sorting domain
LEYSLNGIFFQSSPVFTNLPNGTYSVFVRDENGCLTQSQLIVVFTIDSNEPVVLWGATLQPNPSNGDMQLVLSNAPAGDMRLTIWDGMGRLISTRQLASAGGQVAHSIDLREQPGGVYMIQLRTATATAVFRAVVTK